ncbi:hypothetical protein [Methylobacterium sp. J-076]|uniref:hypothetical protein n=1 Tax=Methylobacterium sp. J-076 TaxID=2836655 RepID=UPI001FBA2372|nr:hypothetical protein [Methylobacterium sp. J-076]MCJ2013866.1 hypothetical protein [Methylobacterium sp. J-076]
MTAPEGPAEKRDVRLDELRARAAPPMQSDLNTVELASAHREQARSMEEKTDGLWQSWLVSVCDGCGDRKPAKALRFEDWPAHDASRPTGTLEAKAPSGTPATAPPGKPDLPARSSLEADLSPENIGAIRRMPPR